VQRVEGRGASPRRSNRELWWAALAVLLSGGAYLLILQLLGGIPAAGELFGHSIGVVGFILMLMTETLYSLRKRSRLARWGRMSEWLNFHIFTGIVGPFLVLLHSSWKFNGLAGVVMLMTVVVVVSGFVGRYFYTAVPRSIDGAELEESSWTAAQRKAAAHARRLLALWHAFHVPLGVALFTAALIHILAALYYVTFSH